MTIKEMQNATDRLVEIGCKVHRNEVKQAQAKALRQEYEQLWGGLNNHYKRIVNHQLNLYVAMSN